MNLVKKYYDVLICRDSILNLCKLGKYLSFETRLLFEHYKYKNEQALEFVYKIENVNNITIKLTHVLKYDNITYIFYLRNQNIRLITTLDFKKYNRYKLHNFIKNELFLSLNENVKSLHITFNTHSGYYTLCVSYGKDVFLQPTYYLKNC